MGFEAVIQTLEKAGFFDYVFPFLLTIAITYGILEHYDFPRSKSARGVITIIIGFMALPVGAVISPFIYGLIRGFVVIACTMLIIIILVETTGLKAAGKESIFELHPRTFSVALVLLGLLIFLGAGGLRVMGISFRLSSELVILLFFLAAITIGVWFITSK